MTRADLSIRAVEWNDPQAVALREAQVAEVIQLYGGRDLEPGPKPNGDDVTVFLVAFDGTTPVACGGLRALGDDHGELKRMYVVPERRGSGAADAILARLEAEARERGWSRLVLETGAEQRAAMRLYERAGYRQIPAFGYYVGSENSLCYEKLLTE